MKAVEPGVVQPGSIRPGGFQSGPGQCRGPLRDLANETVGAGRGGQHHHEVAGPHPAPTGAAEAAEGRAGVGALDLPARRERRFVQRAGFDGVEEVRRRRKLEVDVAFGQCGQYLPVADVLPGTEGTGRDAEWESPRREVRALRNRRADEPVSFEDGVGKAELVRSVRDHGARLQAARRDRDVVFRRRDARHPIEVESVVHRVLPRSGLACGPGPAAFRLFPRSGSCCVSPLPAVRVFLCSVRRRRRCYPDRLNFRKHRGVNGARRSATPDETVTSPT